MARTLRLKDEGAGAVELTAWTPRRGEVQAFRGPAGQDVQAARLIKTTEGHGFEALIGHFGDVGSLTEALVLGDPEVDFEQVGRKTGQADRLWISADGRPLHAARAVEIVESPSGEELSRAEARDVEATIDASSPLILGAMVPIERVVRQFALAHKLQLRHVDAASYDRLFALASRLQEARQMLLVGTGPDGANPLIFQRNGTPHRGFLEGRVRGEGYMLILHLSNLELQASP